MFKIVKSLVLVFAFVVMTAGATQAVFTSQASVVGNTFATGGFELRVDKEPTIPGFTVSNAAPGDSISGGFDIENYGWGNAGHTWGFDGKSTLNAKTIKISAVKTSGDTIPADLWDVLKVKIDSTVGWNTTTVFDGKLKNLVNKEILLPGNELAPGWTMPMTYTVTFPASAGNEYQGLSTTFNFVVDGATS